MELVGRSNLSNKQAWLTQVSSIQNTKTVISLGVALFGSLAVPNGCFHVVLSDAPAATEHVAKGELRIDMAYHPERAYGSGTKRQILTTRSASLGPAPR